MYHEKDMVNEDWPDIEMTHLERVVVFWGRSSLTGF